MYLRAKILALAEMDTCEPNDDVSVTSHDTVILTDAELHDPVLHNEILAALPVNAGEKLSGSSGSHHEREHQRRIWQTWLSAPPPAAGAPTATSSSSGAPARSVTEETLPADPGVIDLSAPRPKWRGARISSERLFATSDPYMLERERDPTPPPGPPPMALFHRFHPLMSRPPAHPPPPSILRRYRPYPPDTPPPGTPRQDYGHDL